MSDRSLSNYPREARLPEVSQKELADALKECRSLMLSGGVLLTAVIISVLYASSGGIVPYVLGIGVVTSSVEGAVDPLRRAQSWRLGFATLLKIGLSLLTPLGIGLIGVAWLKKQVESELAFRKT